MNRGRGLDNFVGFRNPSISYENNKFYGNNRTVNAYKLKDLVSKGHIVIENPELIQELITLRYTFEHNQRRILVSKQVMKDKFKVKSPNIADALIYAVGLIGDVQQEQNLQYKTMPKYSHEDNLFNIAEIH